MSKEEIFTFFITYVYAPLISIMVVYIAHLLTKSRDKGNRKRTKSEKEKTLNDEFEIQHINVLILIGQLAQAILPNKKQKTSNYQEISVFLNLYLNSLKEVDLKVYDIASQANLRHLMNLIKVQIAEIEQLDSSDKQKLPVSVESKLLEIREIALNLINILEQKKLV